MAEKRTVNKIKEDLSFLAKEKILGILLYGSAAKGEETERSDIDIAVVSHDRENNIQLLRKIMMETKDKRYDIKLFELLPLYLKIDIIKNHEVIYTPDIYELYEYFYPFRKKWKDQEHRQRLTREEAIKLIS